VSIAGPAPQVVIAVAGIPNPAFELQGLQAYVEYLVKAGVKAELNRRLAGD
jgi:hypothetical protein